MRPPGGFEVWWMQLEGLLIQDLQDLQVLIVGGGKIGGGMGLQLQGLRFATASGLRARRYKLFVMDE